MVEYAWTEKELEEKTKLVFSLCFARVETLDLIKEFFIKFPNHS